MGLNTGNEILSKDLFNFLNLYYAEHEQWVKDKTETMDHIYDLTLPGDDYIIRLGSERILNKIGKE